MTLPARPRQACGEAAADRIGDLHEDDRDFARLLEHRSSHGCAVGQDQVGLQRDEFFRVSLQRIHVECRPADPKVAAVRPPELLKLLPQRRAASLCLRIVLCKRCQHTDPPHPVGLLLARRERLGDRRAADKGEELAPPHSITFSTRRRNDSGIDSPIAFAVLRLMTNSNLTGCSTGRSAGLMGREHLYSPCPMALAVFDAAYRG